MARPGKSVSVVILMTLFGGITMGSRIFKPDLRRSMSIDPSTR